MNALKIARMFFGSILRLYRFEVFGIEKVPQKGGFIIATNHCSYFDPPAVDLALRDKRPVRFLAKKELFLSPVSGAVMRQINAISVDRSKGDISALKAVIDALKKGDCVCIFPEGTRIKGGKISEPKAGIGFISAKSGAPVLCAHISGTDKFPFASKIAIRIGNMLKYNEDDYKDVPSKTAYRKFSEKILQEIFSITEDNASR